MGDRSEFDIMGRKGSHVANAIYRKRGAIVLVGVISAIVVIMYIETFHMRPDTRRTPQFIIYLSFVTIALIVINQVLGRSIVEILRERFAPIVPVTGRDINFGTSTQADELEADLDQEVNLYDIDVLSSLPKFVWIGVYLLGVMYVGYFTSTTLFVSLYILRYFESASLSRRAVYAIVAASITDVISYLLFVRFLLVYELLDFGFLP